VTAVDATVWLDAWNSQSATPIIAITDPEVEVHAVTLGIEGRHYQGHDGVRQWMRDIRDRFGARTRAEAVTPLGDDAVMLLGTLFIDAEFGGEPDEQRFAMVVHLRDGKARWIGTFFSAADAKAAYEAGVTGPDPGKD
jgi:ketosteroid isomerase-like protein